MKQIEHIFNSRIILCSARSSRSNEEKVQRKIRMKRIKLFIHEPTINKVIGSKLNLSLDGKANLVDAINEVDKMISSKGSFPVSDYQSLLHMIYNPLENRFYNQVAISAFRESGQSLNVRENPKKELLEGITVTLIPAGGCISEWEEAIDYERFLKALSEVQYMKEKVFGQ